MTKKKYDSVRIGSEAKEKLQQLSADNGISMVAGLDRLLQIEGDFTNSFQQALQAVIDKTKATKGKLDEDDPAVRTFIKAGNELGIDWDIPPTQEPRITFDDWDDFHNFFDKLKKEYRESHMKEVQSNPKFITLNTNPTKPPSAIIDASILYSFKQLGKKALTRKDIKESVITMMQESKYPTTWSEIYPKWWKNYKRNKSKFELDFDNRLRRLVKDQLISNEPKSGEYSHNLSKKHWDYVEQLATGFYPQIVIDKIVSITFK